MLIQTWIALLTLFHSILKNLTKREDLILRCIHVLDQLAVKPINDDSYIEGSLNDTYAAGARFYHSQIGEEEKKEDCEDTMFQELADAKYRQGTMIFTYELKEESLLDRDDETEEPSAGVISTQTAEFGG